MLALFWGFCRSGQRGKVVLFWSPRGSWMIFTKSLQKNWLKYTLQKKERCDIISSNWIIVSNVADFREIIGFFTSQFSSKLRNLESVAQFLRIQIIKNQRGTIEN